VRNYETGNQTLSTRFRFLTKRAETLSGPVSDADGRVILGIRHEHVSIEFVLPKQELYRIRGKIVDATTGKPARSVQLLIAPRQSASLRARTGKSSTRSANGIRIVDTFSGADKDV
jgi:hypothetical protein